MSHARNIAETIHNVQEEVRNALPESSSSPCGLADTAVEYDQRTRNAEVFLQIIRVESKVGSVAPFDETKHWAIVFKFSDDSFRFVEGNKYNEKLTAYYYKFVPHSKFKPKYYRLGEIKISPAVVREIAVNNEYNNKVYDAVTMNCQDWIKQYTKQLNNEEILRNMENHDTLFEAFPSFIAAFMVGTAAVGAAVGFSIASGK